MGSIKIWDGSAWQVTAGAGGGSATTYVGTEAPPGTPTTGDMWFDTDDPGLGITLPVAIEDGGTGAADAGTARTNLAVPGIPVTIAQGGTGATSASVARTNLAVPDLPVTIAQGGTGAATAPLARSALAVPGAGVGGFAGSPTTGTWVKGDRWVDSGGYEWICSAAGTPGTWYSPPRGLLVYVDSAVAQTGITTAQTDITGLATPSVSLVSGRRYELSAQVTFFKATTNGNVELYITESNNYVWAKIVHSVNAFGHLTQNINILTANNMSGSYIFKCRALNDAGTLDVLALRRWLRVTDVGVA